MEYNVTSSNHLIKRLAIHQVLRSSQLYHAAILGHNLCERGRRDRSVLSFGDDKMAMFMTSRVLLTDRRLSSWGIHLPEVAAR
jgi:hypothetical protein